MAQPRGNPFLPRPTRVPIPGPPVPNPQPRPQGPYNPGGTK